MERNIYKDNYSFGDILSKSSDIFQERFKDILSITLLVFIPLNIIMFFVGEYLLGSPDITFEDFSNYIKIASRLENIIGVIAGIFIIYVVKETIDGKENTFKTLLKKSLSKWGSGAGGNIFYGLAVGLLLILLIIPGIIFGVFWIFFLQAIVLKDISVTKSLDYSKKLVSGRWWSIFGYGFFSFVSLFILGLALGFTPNIESIYVTLATDIVIDLYAGFLVIIFTLKFLNIDRNPAKKISSDNKEESLNNKKLSLEERINNQEKDEL